MMSINACFTNCVQIPVLRKGNISGNNPSGCARICWKMHLKRLNGIKNLPCTLIGAGNTE